MWFKAFPFLFYTILLVNPTNAASRAQDEAVPSQQQAPAPKQTVADKVPSAVVEHSAAQPQVTQPKEPAQESKPAVSQPAAKSSAAAVPSQVPDAPKSTVAPVVSESRPEKTSAPASAPERVSSAAPSVVRSEPANPGTTSAIERESPKVSSIAASPESSKVVPSSKVEESTRQAPSPSVPVLTREPTSAPAQGPPTAVAPPPSSRVSSAVESPKASPSKSADNLDEKPKTTARPQPTSAPVQIPSSAVERPSSAASSAAEPSMPAPSSRQESRPASTANPLPSEQPSSAATERKIEPTLVASSAVQSEPARSSARITERPSATSQSRPSNAIPSSKQEIESKPQPERQSSQVQSSAALSKPAEQSTRALEQPSQVSSLISRPESKVEQPSSQPLQSEGQTALTSRAPAATSNPLPSQPTGNRGSKVQSTGGKAETSAPIQPTVSQGRADASLTVGFEFPSQVASLLNPSNIQSGVRSIGSSVVPSNIGGMASISIPPVSLPTNVASQAESVLNPSNVGGQLSSVVSQIQSGVSGVLTNIPIPTSEINSIATGLPLPSQPILSIPSELPLSGPTGGIPISTPTGGIPVSIPTGGVPVSVPTGGVPVSILTGVPSLLPSRPVSNVNPLPSLSLSLPDVSLSDASGTGSVPIPKPDATSGILDWLTSQIIKSQATPTAPIESKPSGSPPAASSGALSGVPGSSVQFSLVRSGAPTNAPNPSTASGLASSQGTLIPASESPSKPTNPVTGLPSTTPLSVLPAPGSTAGISGSTNASAIDRSSAVVAVTTGQTPLNSAATSGPTLVDTKATSDGKFLGTTTAANSAATGTNQPISSGGSAGASGASGASTGKTGATGASGYGSLGASHTVPTSFEKIQTASAAPSSSSTTAGGGGDAKPAPLSRSQTAGIAIGGTTCLLIALVAALFLVRRYHANAVKRNSTGSVYPEVAYLYDPKVPGNDDGETGGGVPAMSGGAGGYGPVPANSPRHSWNGAPSNSPLNPFRDPAPASPLPSPRLNGYGGPVGDANGNYANSPNQPFFSAAALEYPPMSPYAKPVQDLPPVPEFASDYSSERDVNPFGDEYEHHDLLLNVDLRSETPDSMVMLTAPPPTPRSINGRYTPENASLAGSSVTTLTNTPPQRSPSPPPQHKGWDDIRLGDAIPIPMPLAPAPAKKLPIAQRRQPPAGAGQMLLSGVGLPLTVKKKEVGSGLSPLKVDRGLGLEIPPLSQVYGSPGPMVDEEWSEEVQRKRSGEMMFADPALVGRQF